MHQSFIIDDAAQGTDVDAEPLAVAPAATTAVEVPEEIDVADIEFIEASAADSSDDSEDDGSDDDFAVEESDEEVRVPYRLTMGLRKQTVSWKRPEGSPWVGAAGASSCSRRRRVMVRVRGAAGRGPRPSSLVMRSPCRPCSRSSGCRT